MYNRVNSIMRIHTANLEYKNKEKKGRKKTKNLPAD
jgi:hypothetical protein